MQHLIVVASVLLRHGRVARIERLVRIVTVVTVRVVVHIRVHIRLIMIQIDRFRACVVRRQVTVVVRRRPGVVGRTAVHIPHRRTFDEHRTNDVVIAVQIRVTHYLYHQHVGTTLCDERSHILEHTRSQTGLDQKRMVIAPTGLNHAQVVNPPVVVEVEVVDHITARVQDSLKLLYRIALCERSRNGIQVEVETPIGVVTRRGERRHRRRTRAGRCNGRGVRRNGWFGNDNCLLLYRNYRPNTCRPAAGHRHKTKDRYAKRQKTKMLSHI